MFKTKITDLKSKQEYIVKARTHYNIIEAIYKTIFEKKITEGQIDVLAQPGEFTAIDDKTFNKIAAKYDKKHFTRLSKENKNEI